MDKMNRTNIPIVIRQGLEADVLASDNYVLEGELGYTTDTRKLYIGNASNVYELLAVSNPYVAKTGAYTLTNSDYTVDCTSGTYSITLPTAVGITGREYNIKNTGAGTITVDANGTETIDDVLTIVLSP